MEQELLTGKKLQAEEEFTVEYFLRKFIAIPEKEWTKIHLNIRAEDGSVRKCALGHCGVRMNIATPESISLDNLFREAIMSVSSVNDGFYYYKHYGKTPKKRILKALFKIRRQQNPDRLRIRRIKPTFIETKKEQVGYNK